MRLRSGPAGCHHSCQSDWFMARAQRGRSVPQHRLHSIPGLWESSVLLGVHLAASGESRKKKETQRSKADGHLGGSVSEASDFGSGHDLVVREFEPSVGLCADSSEPGAASESVSPSFSLCSSPACALSPSKINTCKKNVFLQSYLFHLQDNQI